MERELYNESSRPHFPVSIIINVWPTCCIYTLDSHFFKKKENYNLPPGCGKLRLEITVVIIYETNVFIYKRNHRI